MYISRFHTLASIAADSVVRIKKPEWFLGFRTGRQQPRVAGVTHRIATLNQIHQKVIRITKVEDCKAGRRQSQTLCFIYELTRKMTEIGYSFITFIKVTKAFQICYLQEIYIRFMLVMKRLIKYFWGLWN